MLHAYHTKGLGPRPQFKVLKFAATFFKRRTPGTKAERRIVHRRLCALFACISSLKRYLPATSIEELSNDVEALVINLVAIAVLLSRSTATWYTKVGLRTRTRVLVGSVMQSTGVQICNQAPSWPV